VNARAYPSTDDGSDHQLVFANLRLKLKSLQNKDNTRRTDAARLKNSFISTEYEITVGGRFALLLKIIDEDADVNNFRVAIKKVFHETAAILLGTIKPHRTKDWLSDETRQLADERRVYKIKKRESPKDAKYYSYLGCELKRRGRADKEVYINKLCRRVKYANHQNKSRLVYQGVKLICGRIVSRVGTIKDKNCTPLSDMGIIWRR